MHVDDTYPAYDGILQTRLVRVHKIQGTRCAQIPNPSNPRIRIDQYRYRSILILCSQITKLLECPLLIAMNAILTQEPQWMRRHP